MDISVKIKKCLALLLILYLGLSIELYASEPSFEDKAAQQPTLLNDDNLLVISVEYEDLVLEESFFVFQTPETTFIPVQGLIDTLDFPLNLDLDTLTVDGWFISESSSFSLDIKKQTVFIAGEKLDWPNSFRYADDGFDLYIDHESLEAWFGLKLSLNVSQLSMSVQSNAVLPVVLEKQRKKKQEQISRSTANNKISDYIPNTYDMVGDPGLDIEISYDFEKSNGISGSFSGAVLQGTTDLLGHSLNTSYINQDGEADLRLTFSRSASTVEESMPLGIDLYRFGDVSSRSDTLLFGSSQGSGFHVQRGKNSLLDQSGDILIEGDAPPNWEVELYRNGTLINFSSASATGKYRFEDVATYSGENIFDIKIYGPQGQSRSRQKKISVGAGMLLKNQWEYQLYGLKENNNFISSNINGDQEISDFFLLEGSYGLNEYLTIQSGINRAVPNNEIDPHDYQFVSLFTSLDGNLATFKFANDLKSGTAWASSLKGRWFDTNVNIDLFKFNHLVSDRSSNGQLRLDSRVKINSLIHNILSRPISYDIELRYTEQRTNGQKQLMLSNALSSYWGRTQFAHRLNHSHSSSALSHDTLDGKFSAVRRFSAWRTKAELSYGIAPSMRFQGVTTSASYQAGRFSYQATVDYLKATKDILTLSNTVTWNTQPLALSFRFGLNTDERYFVGLGLSTSLAYNKAKQNFTFDKGGFSSSARVLAHAYIDANNNNVFDEDDQALPGITFNGRNEWKHSPTDSKGYALLTGIPNQSMQRIAIDESSIDDPFMRVKTPQYYLYSHAGKQNELEFHLVPTLELEGEIFRLVDGKRYPSPNIPLRLYDDHQELFASTTSEYDGIYLLDSIIPGKYRLEVSPAYLDKYNYQPVEQFEIEVDGSEGVYYFDTIILKKK